MRHVVDACASAPPCQQCAGLQRASSALITLLQAPASPEKTQRLVQMQVALAARILEEGQGALVLLHLPEALPGTRNMELLKIFQDAAAAHALHVVVHRKIGPHRQAGRWILITRHWPARRADLIEAITRAQEEGV